MIAGPCLCFVCIVCGVAALLSSTDPYEDCLVRTGSGRRLDKNQRLRSSVLRRQRLEQRDRPDRHSRCRSCSVGGSDDQRTDSGRASDDLSRASPLLFHVHFSALSLPRQRPPAPTSFSRRFDGSRALGEIGSRPCLVSLSKAKLSLVARNLDLTFDRTRSRRRRRAVLLPRHIAQPRASGYRTTDHSSHLLFRPSSFSSGRPSSLVGTPLTCVRVGVFGLRPARPAGRPARSGRASSLSSLACTQLSLSL